MLHTALKLALVTERGLTLENPKVSATTALPSATLFKFLNLHAAFLVVRMGATFSVRVPKSRFACRSPHQQHSVADDAGGKDRSTQPRPQCPAPGHPRLQPH